jgi:hypothetical protein
MSSESGSNSQINLVLLMDKSDEAGQIRFKAGYVHWTFSAAIFDDSFERSLLTISLIDLILFPLTS